MTAAEDIKVLLVDDEPHFIKMLAERLSVRGFSVETAGGGSEAVERVKEEPYDAIVLDLLMPEMDGLETLKQLKEINPDLQVILLTGHGTVDKGVEAMKLGAMDFVEKPADFHDLLFINSLTRSSCRFSTRSILLSLASLILASSS